MCSNHVLGIDPHARDHRGVISARAKLPSCILCRFSRTIAFARRAYAGQYLASDLGGMSIHITEGKEAHIPAGITGRRIQKDEERGYSTSDSFSQGNTEMAEL